MGLSIALEHMERQIINEGLLPVFELRRKVFGETPPNGKDKHMPADNTNTMGRGAGAGAGANAVGGRWCPAS